MKPATIQIGNIVQRKDGVWVKICHYGERFGTFRARTLETHEMVDLRLDQIALDTPANQTKRGASVDLEDLNEEELRQVQAVVVGEYSRRKLI